MAYDGRTYRTKRERLNTLRAELEMERASFIPQWKDAAAFVLPRRARFTLTDTNRGDRRNNKIINGVGTYAARTMRSGMMAGITSPARPWMRLTTPDPDLAEFGAVKDWLHIVTRRMLDVYRRSNLYQTLPAIYHADGVFGTAAMSIEEDWNDVIRTQGFPVGSYMLAADHRGRINTFYRQYRMTVHQLVTKFGVNDEKSGAPNWSVFSKAIKNYWDNGQYQTWIDVNHVIQPNPDFFAGSRSAKHKRFESCYYEAGTSSSARGYFSGDDHNKYLRESGYDFFPILCPRWETDAEDVYGTSCPAIDAIGDIKALQTMEKRKAQAIEKMVNPPMKAPTHLMNQKASILPGDITWVDEDSATGSFKPIHEVNPRIQELTLDMKEYEMRIQRAFYEDLFLMLAQSDRRQITAREVEERHEEKLLALGPVMEQLNQDLLDPLIDNTFEIMLRKGMIPAAPKELEGMALRVEYTSIMAQAQKALALAGIERLAGFVGNVAALLPEALDKIDVDQAIDEYGDSCGVSPRLIRSDEVVAQIREKRAQAQQAQQEAAMIQQGSMAAKNLSQSSMEGDNALNRLIRTANAGNVAQAG